MRLTAAFAPRMVPLGKEPSMGKDQKRKDLARVLKTHAGERASERFGIVLRGRDDEEIRRLIKELRASGAQKTMTAVRLQKEQASGNRSAFAVRFKGEWIPLVYDHRLDVIITVLPDYVLRNNGFVPPREATALDRLWGYLLGRKVPDII